MVKAYWKIKTLLIFLAIQLSPGGLASEAPPKLSTAVLGAG
jgi:hypothetical protein